MKAQAAAEFLVTYGWAIVIMLSVMSIMFYLGFFSPTTVAPSACVLPAGFSCNAYKITDGGDLTLVVVQSTGSTLRLDGIDCSEDDAPVWNTTGFPKRVYSGESAELSTTCFEVGHVNTPHEGKYYKGTIFISYLNEDTNFTHSAIGEISYQVEGD